MPITPFPLLAQKSENTRFSTIRNSYIHRLTDRHPVKLTSMHDRQYLWHHNKGRHPLMKPVAIVKTNRSTSLDFSLQTDRPRLDHVDHYLSIAEDTQSGWKMIYL